MKKHLLILLAIGFLDSCTNIGKEKKNPNIVYILADDMGYGDLSSLNTNSGIQTPNMDKIVKEGIYFTDAHSNSSVCTPTRYGILTGRYAWRSPLKKGVLWGYDQPLIEEERETVASFLKDNGYQTACIGKWHLGLGWKAKDSLKPIVRYEWTKVFNKEDDSNVNFSKPVSGPNALGFDYSYIIPASLDMTPYLYLENGKAVELPTAYTAGKNQDVDGRGVFWRAGEVAPGFDFYTVLDQFTEKAVSYIENRKEETSPFFLYLPLSAPHTPWLPSSSVEGTSEAGKYGDFVTQVDQTVGQVLQALEKAGKSENTLIIVTSDNGSNWTLQDQQKFKHRANYIYRGQKADIYEGGHRIPYIAKWPSKIKPDSKSNQIICTTDLLATVSAIINKPLPDEAGEDSINMLSAYLGTDKGKQIREYTIHHSLEGFFSIRKGKWKLTTKLGSGGFTTPINDDPKEEGKAGTLYNLQEDIKEQTNLYNQYPDVVGELTQLLEKEKNRS
ncbi:MAG: arylsulfatase [Flavobacteriaceae bacterium]